MLDHTDGADLGQLLSGQPIGGGRFSDRVRLPVTGPVPGSIFDRPRQV